MLDFARHRWAPLFRGDAHACDAWEVFYFLFFILILS
jgi:hypothetical protein